MVDPSETRWKQHPSWGAGTNHHWEITILGVSSHAIALKFIEKRIAIHKNPCPISKQKSLNFSTHPELPVLSPEIPRHLVTAPPGCRRFPRCGRAKKKLWVTLREEIDLFQVNHFETTQLRKTSLGSAKEMHWKDMFFVGEVCRIWKKNTPMKFS